MQSQTPCYNWECSKIVVLKMELHCFLIKMSVLPHSIDIFAFHDLVSSITQVKSYPILLKNLCVFASNRCYFEPVMKKYTWIVLLIVAAAGIVALVLYDNGEANLRDETNFAIENPEDVTKVLMKDRDGNAIILEKKDDTWYVNSEKAFQPKIDLLLNKALNKIRIKGPVPNSMRNSVISAMGSRSIHIEVFEGNKKIRNYYLGTPTPDESGSYLHIEGAKTPYIAHILGFNGILDPKFSTNIDDWIDRSVFDYTPAEIESITVQNNELPQESFKLSQKDSNYTLTPPLPNLTTSAARSYFALFKFKNYEGFAEYLSPADKDSIRNSRPFMTITVKTYSGQSKTLNIFRKGSNDSKTIYDKNGDLLVKDTDRYFATFTDFDRLVTIQDYVFGKIITKRSFFGLTN